MAVLTIRDVPDDLLQQLKELARQNRRSLQQEAIVQLEQARLRSRPDPMQRIRALREAIRQDGLPQPDVVAELREDREHGH